MKADRRRLRPGRKERMSSAGGVRGNRGVRMRELSLGILPAAGPSQAVGAEGGSCGLSRGCSRGRDGHRATPQLCHVRVTIRRGRPISIWKMNWAGNVRWGIEWAACPARGSEEEMRRCGQRTDTGDRKGARPDLGLRTRPACLALLTSLCVLVCGADAVWDSYFVPGVTSGFSFVSSA